MTFSVVSTAIPAEGIDDTPGPSHSVPFGRTGCAILPDGTYLVAVYYDTEPTDLVRVWKIASDGTVLGDIVIDTGGDFDGRMHLCALDGFLVQALYMTANFPGGKSYVLDCSGDDPVLVDEWDDPLPTGGYGSDNGNVYSLYLRVPGVVVVQHGLGVSLYRRGRPLLNRSGPNSGGGSGIYPHPTDPRKCAFWCYSETYELEAVEVTIVGDNAMTAESMGFGIDPATIYWAVGQGSPYATTPITLNEDGDSLLTIVEAQDPLNVLWSDPTPGAGGGAGAVFGINSDALATSCGDGVDRFVFCHELWQDLDPDDPYRIRCGLVDNSTGTPVVEQLWLEYGASSPDMVGGVPGGGEFYVSLLTGSHSISHRNGETVIATCVVEQGGSPNYYSVIVWKITGGDRAPLSGFADPTWRQGINNGTGRLRVQSSVGWLTEAGEGPGLDAPAKPVLTKTSDGWKVLGRFVADGDPTLPEPEPPETVEITYVPTDFNADLAAAQAVAGATYGPIGGKTWGAFVAQASPPAEGDLSDGSDATFTTLAQPDGVGGPVEVLTARMTPLAAVPPGATPIAAAITIRAKAGAAATLGSWIDGQVTTNGGQVEIRGKTGLPNLRLSYDRGPTFTTSSHGAGTTYVAYPTVPPAQTPSGYVAGTSLADALVQSFENAGTWWHDYLTAPGSYLVFQAPGENAAHGPFDLAEFSITIKYLIL